ncbi:DUF4294 domain-containing protein [Subsaximicrobium wynnwilliamsii]|uniref:DUF4294 domain-containing protein n=1 Tax=Subsaximicrobium wynnwilliamsii TaxID=291179 RepID=A0A5C6ZNV5_9FLAO|nr:DUF4294 domain-containing protein [Subsaximicrobium wynnwilliamsii]TXD84730.1 DUF4294 domain-containing protein [Subsaximicrobium wynnwilliamsii]TXD90400.1 DUF4294 domain-containing protein [Subsaximicrobium wynnwilliamsii]TXE04876.1 DUF4294 domain-containing protein [Subsaximicrobium wynnwilliamsii]
MKAILYILLILPMLVVAQVDPEAQDSTMVQYIYVEGDSIPKTAIDLSEVLVLSKLDFNSKDERIRYLILRRKTLKVYPYAKLAADRLTTLNERLERLDKNYEKRRYAKKIQKYIEDEFSAELKKLTKTEGQILVKLIHRQTGNTTFDLIKELRSGWRAFWFNTTANLFDISLKEEFDPMLVEEDFLIEDILERAFQQRLLERQKPAVKFDFYDLSDKWRHNTAATKTKD